MNAQGTNRVLGTLHKIAAWPAVLVIALVLSWWSIDWVALHYGVPALLAAGVSTIFDAAALVVAGLAQRYATSADSAAGPKITMFALLAGSAYLNITHAQIAGYGLPAQIMFSAPAVVAVVLFEHEIGWSNRERRRAAGRVAPALPVIGRWAWLFHPVRSIAVLWRATGAHLDELSASIRTPATAAGHYETGDETALDTPGTVPATEAGPDQGDTGDEAALPTGDVLAGMTHASERVRYADAVLDGASPADVAAWLVGRGYTVTPDYVRSVRSRDRARSATVVNMSDRARAAR